MAHRHLQLESDRNALELAHELQPRPPNRKIGGGSTAADSSRGQSPVQLPVPANESKSLTRA